MSSSNVWLESVKVEDKWQWSIYCFNSDNKTIIAESMPIFTDSLSAFSAGADYCSTHNIEYKAAVPMA